MKVAFRVDASLEIGSGHVMRCLTLANGLKANGAQCHFISREHPGHLLELIRENGHEVTSLPSVNFFAASGNTIEPQLDHAEWLGCNWQADSLHTSNALRNTRSDWLVVDHYAIDKRWESAMAPYYDKLLVIDDLADREHQSDLLVDQNLGRKLVDYTGLVPEHCKLLVGPSYALLRPEFAKLRYYSLLRRKGHPDLRELLITMGGVDKINATCLILHALKRSALPKDCRITVVMGSAAPWLRSVREIADEMPWTTEVVFDIRDMARLMADSDLAIGAVGGTSWERCCLGLPTLMVLLADNQKLSAYALDEIGAAVLVGSTASIEERLPKMILGLIQSKSYIPMGLVASSIVEGTGITSIIKLMEMTHG